MAHYPELARSVDVYSGRVTETVFTYAAPALKFGIGASAEIGYDLLGYGARRVLLVTDAGLAATGRPQQIAEQMTARGLEVTTFADARVEPTDESLIAAIDFARDSGPFDAIVAVGGGSAIDTAKAVNLLCTNPGELMDYINAPVGKALAPVNRLMPLVAVPTTTGTGSESTTICVLDVLALHVKTGISHPALRPTLAVVDPDLTLTQPAMVTAASGMDILCHALESYTARWFADFDAKQPEQRVPYCGANPIADMWSEKALSLLAGSFRAAVIDGSDVVAREQMALAATFAGLGFGNAGVHIPHANAYPIAGRVRDYRPAGYPPEEPIVPHGMAVSLTAPEAFRFTFDAAPERHLKAARLLDPDASGTGPDVLPQVLATLMRDIGIPNGLGEVGYGEADVDDLVEGALKQQRLLATAPKEVTGDDLAGSDPEVAGALVNLGRRLFVGAGLVYVGLWLLAAVTLPDQVPVHFGGSGGVDRYTGRGEALATFGVIGVVLGGVLAGVAAGTGRIPLAWLNVPHKGWWAATPERERQMRTMMTADLWWIAALTMALLCLVLGATVHVADDPEPRLGAAIFVAIGVYLLAVLALGWYAVARRYRPPPTELPQP